MTPKAPSAPEISESQFQSQVIELATLLGFTLIYHTHDSRRSPSGFPDLVLVSGHRAAVLFRELKKESGRVSGTQKDWIAGLQSAGQDAGVWRPSDMKSGRIIRELRGEA